MSPILGIWASQISGHLWAPAGAYDALATVTLSATTSSVTFSGIPTGYKHLQIRAFTQSSGAGTGYTNNLLQFNSDTGSNYAAHILYANPTAGIVVAGAYTTSTSSRSGGVNAEGGLTNTFAASIVDILDYSSTSKYKTVRSLSGSDGNNSSGSVYLESGLWQSTAAISSITFTIAGGTNFNQYSQFALYGVK